MVVNEMLVSDERLTMDRDSVVEILDRLRRLEEKLDHVSVSSPTRSHYSASEVAEILGNSLGTVQKWCREGRIRCAKRAAGRGRAKEWSVTHEELVRIQNEGLLAPKIPAYRYQGQ